MRSQSLLGLGVVAALVTGALANGQCDPGWLPGGGLAGVDGDVFAMVSWDPDGAGPATPKLVVGGLFNIVSSTIASNVAMWDPDNGSWAALGAGCDGEVDALTVLASGELVAGGKFTHAGGVSASKIAKWNGTNWTAVGSGFDNDVRGLYTMPNGDLLAGGKFLNAGAVAAKRIAKWNGSTWAAIGNGFDNDVLGFTVWNGDLIAGGVFTFSGPTAVSRVARWTGSAWAPLGAGVNAGVNSFVTLANGDLAVGGIFGSAGGNQIWGVAAWNGTLWSQLGAGLNDNQVSRIIRDANGDLIAAGHFSIGGSGVARWNGSTWTGVGAAASGGTKALAVLPDGSMFMGGVFETANSKRANGVAKLVAGAWAAMAPDVGPNTPVLSMGVMANGKVVVSGIFDAVSALPNTQGVAVWNGAGWESLTTGLNTGYVESFDTASNGDLLAAGPFSKLGGVAASGIARWNGTAWAPIGGGIANNGVYVVKALSNGSIAVGGGFASAGGVGGTRCLAKWNGSSWTGFGANAFSGSFDGVVAITELPNGDVLVGGYFASAGGTPASNIARWNGTSWSALGSGISGNGSVVSSIARFANGDIVAAGYFSAAGGSPANSVAKWNGTTWSDMSNGLASGASVNELILTPAGSLVAGGLFSLVGGANTGNLAIWTGSTWTQFAGGTGPLEQPVTTMASGAAQQLFVGGQFATINNSVSVYFAQYTFGLPLQITAQPQDAALVPGQTALFNVGATLHPSNTFEWRKDNFPLANGARISGADTSTLQISGVQNSDQGFYSCRVSGNCGSATSDGGALSCVPIVSQQPPLRIALKRSKQLTFQVPLSAPYTYQWRRYSTPLANIAGVLAGTTSRTLTFLSPEIDLWGVYDCVITDECGQTTTATAHVCLGDLNADGFVDDSDFVLFVQAYNLLLCDDGAMPAGCPSDFNNDTVVEDADFSYFAQAYDVLVCP